MAEPADPSETLTHRLILPRDANHYGTLYAGALLSFALEAAYATAYRSAGPRANLVLRRVLDLRCYEPVRVGSVVEVRGREVHRAAAHLVIALYGSPRKDGRGTPWLDAAMQFVQVDDTGRPERLEREPPPTDPDLTAPWSGLRERALRLLAVRS